MNSNVKLATSFRLTYKLKQYEFTNVLYNDINFNKKKILITGGAGFIGSNLAFYFQQNFPDSEVVIFDCFRNEEYFSNGNLKSFGHYKNLINFKGHIICGNINVKADLAKLDDYTFDFIFHHAAISDTRVYDQEIIMQTNVNTFYSLLAKTKKDGAAIVYASSAATYGSQISPQTIGKESPENPYGFSKFVMDQMANKFSLDNPEISIVGLRFFNVFGPKEFYKGKTSSMILQLGHQILSGEAPRLFDDSNKIFRDFIYIEDVIQANIKASKPLKSGTYNIGTGVARSFQEISDILQIELSTELGTDYFPNPYNGYQKHTQADISLSIENLSFKPRFSLEDGIKAYIPEIIDLYNLKTL